VRPVASRVLAYALRAQQQQQQQQQQQRGFAALPDHTVVGLPALSPTMTHGNLAQWHKKVGSLGNFIALVGEGWGKRKGGGGGRSRPSAYAVDRTILSHACPSFPFIRPRGHHGQ
jgi:hypothetical protein